MRGYFSSLGMGTQVVSGSKKLPR